MYIIFYTMVVYGKNVKFIKKILIKYIISER